MDRMNKTPYDTIEISETSIIQEETKLIIPKIRRKSYHKKKQKIKKPEKLNFS